MVRLLWKELTYNWWLTFAACGVGLLLMLSGDPVFWSDSLTLKSFWLMLVACLDCQAGGRPAAGVWGSVDPWKNRPTGMCMSFSSDGKWAVHGAVNVTRGGLPHTYLIDTSSR